VLQRFIHDGLLAAAARRDDSTLISGVQFSHQRFGDHLIARHLLDTHLVTDTEQRLRRCFYRNRPLGAPFRLDQWGRQFAEPGIAAALMLEFPERMKRSPFSHELLSYLPKATRLVTPVKDVFLEGLYWRSADAFTDETDRLVSFFLTRVDDWTRDETFEVLVGLAAAYGVSMRFWADPHGEKLRRAIVPFGRSLVKEMFVANAPYATKHILQRGYAVGVIALARKINPRAIATRQVSLLSPPFAQIPSPFVDPAAIDEAAVKDSRQAMHMDFANYTIGRLVPDRGNYQDAHPGYEAVRLQIARRMLDLGYSAEFSELDRSIAQMQPVSRQSDGGKTDRYGKK
jgi:hypothetical protein